MMTPSSTAIPNSAMKPTQMAVFISTFMIPRPSMPPAKATGIWQKIIRATGRLRNCK